MWFAAKNTTLITTKYAKETQRAQRGLDKFLSSLRKFLCGLRLIISFVLEHSHFYVTSLGFVKLLVLLFYNLGTHSGLYVMLLDVPLFTIPQTP